MKNGRKLQVFTTTASGLLVLFAIWGALTYGNIHTFAVVAGIGGLIVGIPWGLSYLKLWFARWRQHRRSTSSNRRAGTILVSGEALSDPDEVLSTITAALEDTKFSPELDQSSEKLDLTIGHTGFHNVFVRITDSDKLVLSGEAASVEPLAEIIESVTNILLHKTSSNPLLERKPIQKGPRTILSVFIVVLFIAGLLVGLNAAYPPDAYNSAERVVLVSLDARNDLDPTVSKTETTLAKAAFHITILEEERTEVKWLDNDTSRIMKQAHDSVFISNRARELLSTAERRSLTDSQHRRVDALRRDLGRAERKMAITLLNVVRNGTITDPERVTELQRIIDKLQNRRPLSGSGPDSNR